MSVLCKIRALLVLLTPSHFYVNPSNDNLYVFHQTVNPTHTTLLLKTSYTENSYVYMSRFLSCVFFFLFLFFLHLVSFFIFSYSYCSTHKSYSSLFQIILYIHVYQHVSRYLLVVFVLLYFCHINFIFHIQSFKFYSFTYSRSFLRCCCYFYSKYEYI